MLCFKAYSRTTGVMPALLAGKVTGHPITCIYLYTGFCREHLHLYSCFGGFTYTHIGVFIFTVFIQHESMIIPIAKYQLLKIIIDPDWKSTRLNSSHVR